MVNITTEIIAVLLSGQNKLSLSVFLDLMKIMLCFPDVIIVQCLDSVSRLELADCLVCMKL